MQTNLSYGTFKRYYRVETGPNAWQIGAEIETQGQTRAILFDRQEALRFADWVQRAAKGQTTGQTQQTGQGAIAGTTTKAKGRGLKATNRLNRMTSLVPK